MTVRYSFIRCFRHFRPKLISSAAKIWSWLTRWTIRSMFISMSPFIFGSECDVCVTTVSAICHLSVSPNCHLGDRRNFPTPSVCMNPSFIIWSISTILFPVCLSASSPQSGRRSDSGTDKLARRELTYAAPPRGETREEEHFVPTAPSVFHMSHKRRHESSNGHHSPHDKLEDHEQTKTTPAPMVPARMDSAREQMEKSKASQVCRRMCYYSQNNV